MKKSFYNIISRLSDGSALLANLLSGAVIRLTETDFELFIKFRDGEERVPSLELQNILSASRILIPDDFDELAYIESRFNYFKFRTDILSLTILPTMDCNFDCNYCYENTNNTYMSDQTMNALANYVAINLQGKKKMSVAWFGGEPLMAQDVIWKLSRFFNEICSKLRINYDARIITNGSLLSDNVVDRLLENGITEVHITVDGPPEIHNRMRPFSKQHSPTPETYELILNNIDEVCDKINVTIRINISRENVDYIYNLLKMPQMQTLKGRINGIYCSPLVHFGVGNKIKSEIFIRSCYGVYEFARREVELARIMEKCGFFYNYNFDGSNCDTCRAISVNHWVVDPNGNMFKCWDSPGDDSAIIGHITKPPIDEPLMENEKLLKWLSYNPLHRKECRFCKILPLCMGGCPYRSIVVNAEPNQRCNFLKSNYKQMLYQLYLSQNR